MMLSDNELDILIFGFGAPGILGGFIWIGIVIYLKHKWLLQLEDILDDGVRFYSLNIFLAGQGVLQYATVFSSRFHAKRFGMLEKREKVPKHIQRWFIFAMWWFVVCCILAFGSAAVLQINS
ncbi:hypothetical protein [Marinomonas spartinae]|uniref:hypothetical protein n=1 Tax=Marinomonas spartinae TaxID=1792290 RepID=UPI001C2FD3E0|nr:hypothetical protein [Marinomonas spartinae]